MKVLVTGDRDWIAYRVIRDRLARLPRDTIIVHGAARGADTLAGKAADQLDLVVHRHPAAWTARGLAAGPLRNQIMLAVEQPDLVIAFHDDLARSKGTRDMVDRAEAGGVPVEQWDSHGRQRR